MIPLILGAIGAGAILGWLIVTISNARPRKRKKMPSLTKYVVFSISILLIYTIAEFVFACITQTTHDTLTTCIYACFGGEILSCALIKIFKLKEENNADGFSDR